MAQVQTLVVARGALRKEPAYAQVALLAYSMLTELCMHCDVSMAFKQLKARPMYATPLTLGSGAAGAQMPPTGAAAAAAGPVHSAFRVPGTHLLPRLLLETSGLRPLYEARDAPARARAVRELAADPYDVRAELRAFAPFSNPHYALRREPPRADRFTPAEDRLFALGIFRCGIDRHTPTLAVALPATSQPQP